MSMKTRNYLELSQYMIKLLKTAYKKCSKQKVDVKDKGSSDLVTSLDISLEKFITTALKKDFHETKIVSEEFNSKVEAKGTYFVLDPLDGTINFANGLNSLCGLQIAYIENDVTVASAIYFPSSDSAYTAAKGFGSFENGKKYVVTPKLVSHSLLKINTAQSDFDTMYKLLEELKYKFLRFRVIGADCYDFAESSLGNFGGLVMRNGNPWDILPGLLLAEQAECKITTYKDYIIVTNTEEAQSTILKAFRKIFKQKKQEQKENKNAK